MAAKNDKAWHVVVMNRYTQVSDTVILSGEGGAANASKVLFEKLKKEYAETHPQYTVTREWF